MYWICVSLPELEAIIDALRSVYQEGVSTDKEQEESEELEKLAVKLEFFRDTDK